MKKINTQQQRLLEALREAGSEGVNSYYATYKMNIKQAPTRLFEIKQMGFAIIKRRNNDGSVNWILAHEPKQYRSQDYKPTGQWVYVGNTAIWKTIDELKPQQEAIYG